MLQRNRQQKTPIAWKNISGHFYPILKYLFQRFATFYKFVYDLYTHCPSSCCGIAQFVSAEVREKVKKRNYIVHKHYYFSAQLPYYTQVNSISD
jgi:hypothetical protein